MNKCHKVEHRTLFSIIFNKKFTKKKEFLDIDSSKINIIEERISYLMKIEMVKKYGYDKNNL